MVVDGLLLQSERHHVNADLAVAGAFVAADALVVGLDPEPAPAQPGKESGLDLHQLGQRTPVAAPDLATQEGIEGHGQDAHQPDVGIEPVKVNAHIGLSRQHAVAILDQDQHGHRHGRNQDGCIHPLPANGGLALGRQVPPAVTEGLGQSPAPADPGAVTLALEQHEDRNQHKGQEDSPDHPDLVGIVKEGVEEQGPGIDDAVAAPGLIGKGRIGSQLRSHPLVFHRGLKQELGNEKKEDPLKAQEGNITPDLKLVLAVESPALHGFQSEGGHQKGV